MLAEGLAAAGDDDTQRAAQLARARRERDAARNAVARLTAELEDMRRTLDVVESAENATLAPPRWLQPPKSKRTHRATTVLLLSDMHFDEVVDPSEVGGLNAYDRPIAELRLKTWAENAIKLARDHLAGVTHDGCVVLLGATACRETSMRSSRRRTLTLSSGRSCTGRNRSPPRSRCSPATSARSTSPLSPAITAG